MTRILILSASVGAGHVRAAEAIKAALNQRLPDATIVHQDVLQLTNPLFRKAYGKGYFQLVKHAPNVVSALYDRLDKPDERGIAKKARVTFERANFTALTRLLRQNWGLVINTHFLPPEIIAHLRKNEQVKFPQVTVVTDFDVQGLWIHKPCEGYFVANEEARAYMIALGIDPNTIHTSGIPIDPVFAETKNRDACRRKHGFSIDTPLILQMAGGFGIGSIEKIYRSLNGIATPLQICVVTGKNKAIKQQLEKISQDSHHPCRILGFTDKIDELMAATDVMISKPGGLTTSESLARGCPMVIVEPIPGQEDRNSDFLLENGCAIKPLHLETLGHKLESLLNDPDRLQRMKDAARRCSHPHAAQEVAEYCVQLLASYGKNIVELQN